jgi:hypothetical protein
MREKEKLPEIHRLCKIVLQKTPSGDYESGRWKVAYDVLELREIYEIREYIEEAIPYRYNKDRDRGMKNIAKDIVAVCNMKRTQREIDVDTAMEELNAEFVGAG